MGITEFELVMLRRLWRYGNLKAELCTPQEESALNRLCLKGEAVKHGVGRSTYWTPMNGSESRQR